jgi:hypothetical protein
MTRYWGILGSVAGQAHQPGQNEEAKIGPGEMLVANRGEAGWGDRRQDSKYAPGQLGWYVPP